MAQTWADLGIDESRLGPGENKVVCPECGPTRKNRNDTSLSVNTDLGVFKCHNCDWAGKLHSNDHYEKPRYYNRTDWKAPKADNFKASTTDQLPENVINYFADRGISRSTLLDHDVRWGLGHSFKRNTGTADAPKFVWPEGEEIWAIYFPYYRDGELVNFKARRFDKKDFRLKAKAQKIYWNLDAMKAGGTIIIVEGEIDLLSFAEAGIHNVVSVPNGSSVSDYNVACSEELKQVTRFILATDGDQSGVECRNELANSLGKEKCLYVTYPEGTKDANEVLLKYGARGLHDLLQNAKAYPVEGLVSGEDLYEEVRLYYQFGMPIGASTGFKSLDSLYRIPDGSFSIWVGRPGHGKSQTLNQLMINLAQYEDQQIAFFSPEDSPTSALSIKLLMKYVDKPYALDAQGRMTEAEMEAGMRWIHQHFTFIAPTSSTWSIDEVLKLAKTAVFQRGIKQLVLDPWNEFDHARPPGLSEQEYYSQALSKLRQFGRDYGPHVHLVAHPRKGDRIKKDGEMVESIPDLDDAAGSHHFRAKADFGISIWRDTTEQPKDGVTNLQFRVLKVRQPWNGKIGGCDLKWNVKTGRVFDTEESVPRSLPPEMMNELEEAGW